MKYLLFLIAINQAETPHHSNLLNLDCLDRVSQKIESLRYQGTSNDDLEINLSMECKLI